MYICIAPSRPGFSVPRESAYFPYIFVDGRAIAMHVMFHMDDVHCHVCMCILDAFVYTARLIHTCFVVRGVTETRRKDAWEILQRRLLSGLLRVALSCAVLQWTAVCICGHSPAKATSTWSIVCCSALRCVVACCIVLQWAAVCWTWQWGFYRNVMSMRWDCGKNPILSIVYLTGSHRIFPSQRPSSQIAMVSQRFTDQTPLQERETFSKNTSCMFLKNIHTRGVLWESFVFLEGDLTCEALRSHRNLWRGSLRWENAMGSCKVNTA